MLTYTLQLAWHQTEHTLRGLHCGREYHIYVILNNAMGASPASKVFETKFSLKYIEDALFSNSNSASYNLNYIGNQLSLISRY